MKKHIFAVLVGAIAVPGVSQADLLAQWDFDNTTLDSSGNGYDGIDGAGTLTYGASGDGGAYAVFDGVSSYVPTMLSFENEKLSSLGLTVNFNTTYYDPNGVYYDDATTEEWDSYYSNWSFIDADRSDYFSLSLDSHGSLWFAYITKENNQWTLYENIATDYTYNDGLWHQATVSYGEEYGLSMYVDGALIYTDIYHGALGTGNTTRYVIIGDGSESSEFNGARNNAYFEGALDSVSVYDSEISAADAMVFFNDTNLSSINDVPAPLGALSVLGMLGLAVRKRKPC